jgi:hypothetical protein
MFSADSRTDHFATFVRRNKKFSDKAESRKQEAQSSKLHLKTQSLCYSLLLFKSRWCVESFPVLNLANEYRLSAIIPTRSSPTTCKKREVKMQDYQLLSAQSLSVTWSRAL